MKPVLIEVTQDNVFDFYHALRLYGAKRKLTYICNIYPEILQMYHEDIAELLGMERETVTRNIADVKRRINHKEEA